MRATRQRAARVGYAYELRVEARNGRRQTQTEIEAEKAAMLAALLTHFP